MARCKECGLLGLRDETTGGIAEVDERNRNDGSVGRNRVGPVLCCGGVTAFPREPADAVAAIAQDRECSRFLSWKTGFLPKEHIQMYDHELQTERDRRWRQEDLALVKLQAAKNNRVVVVAAIIGVIGMLLTNWLILLTK